MGLRKILFIDRDGTLIVEPTTDFQVDRLEKLQFVERVIPSLIALMEKGYQLVMVTNQDGLGSPAFPLADFNLVQDKMLAMFASQGITFLEVLVCPHLPADHCHCRKPAVGLVQHFLKDRTIDWAHCFMIGDREADLQLAENMGIQGIRWQSGGVGWPEIVQQILGRDRQATVTRKTSETNVKVSVNLDQAGTISVQTGMGFFDHMLEQVAQHGGFNLDLLVNGDLKVDDHHTVEDTALGLGQAIREALGDKWGIHRFGFLLPMDETQAQLSLDICDRPFLKFTGVFPQTQVGGFATEMVTHFFQSFSQSLGASLHVQVEGENTHHMVEACFKGLGRVLRQAIKIEQAGVPSTKGAL